MKEHKRTREGNDLFELMNQEDLFYTKPSQRLRVKANKPKLVEKDKAFEKALYAIKDMKAKQAITTDRVLYAAC